MFVISAALQSCFNNLNLQLMSQKFELSFDAKCDHWYAKLNAEFVIEIDHISLTFSKHVTVDSEQKGYQQIDCSDAIPFNSNCTVLLEQVNENINTNLSLGSEQFTNFLIHYEEPVSKTVIAVSVISFFAVVALFISSFILIKHRQRELAEQRSQQQQMLVTLQSSHIV
ncbi:Hypothetical_protein [Hexamita inflata]|uniref:Hypothetical_protein n=1 Tax=Hexamita inflata TaxID=28002 RepID=A0AA86RHH2_9EUKA|nr:Hypothetical protein HINF_LOCUS60382 [Hexamita inflata]